MVERKRNGVGDDCRTEKTEPKKLDKVTGGVCVGLVDTRARSSIRSSNKCTDAETTEAPDIGEAI